MKYLSEHFRDTEFACRCGCGAGLKDGDVSKKLLKLLEEMRKIYGRPMVITSGVRCAKHNAEVGGVANSAHLTGEAADIHTLTGSDRFDLVEAAVTCGCVRIGVAKHYIHVDVSETLPSPSLWGYGQHG